MPGARQWQHLDFFRGYSAIWPRIFALPIGLSRSDFACRLSPPIGDARAIRDAVQANRLDSSGARALVTRIGPDCWIVVWTQQDAVFSQAGCLVGRQHVVGEAVDFSLRSG